jgi:hypothetical protein
MRCLTNCSWHWIRGFPDTSRRRRCGTVEFGAGLLGLHEFDAFLLIVDQVPWGGAFNPAISTLDLTDVERIEVLKGSAPVMYGATQGFRIRDTL